MVVTYPAKRDGALELLPGVIQPLLAFADLGFFLLRLFLGVLLVEEGWRGMRILFREKRYGALPWLFPTISALLGLLLVTGTVTQLAALVSIAFIAAARPIRESLFPSVRSLGLFAVALLALAAAGGGFLSVDQLFGVILY